MPNETSKDSINKRKRFELIKKEVEAAVEKKIIKDDGQILYLFERLDEDIKAAKKNEASRVIIEARERNKKIQEKADIDLAKIEGRKTRAQVKTEQMQNSTSKILARMVQTKLTISSETYPQEIGLIQELFNRDTIPRKFMIDNQEVLLKVRKDIRQKMATCKLYENKMTLNDKRELLKNKRTHLEKFMAWVGYIQSDYKNTIENQHRMFVLSEIIMICCEEIEK